MIAPTDLRTQAIAAFNQYMQVWNFEDFWTRANTFDAAIQFVTAARSRWPNDPEIRKSMRQIDEVIFANIKYFQDTLANIDSIWADDFGWCGNASLSARAYILQFPDTEQIVKGAGAYLTIADRCWSNMKDIGYDATDRARPVPHGCSNNSKVSQHPPMKNTVTNAVLFLLSSRLYEATKNLGGFNPSSYLAMSKAQYDWFHAWFDPKYGYLNPPVAPISNAKLIGERPIAEPDYENKFMWEEGLVWTGDQGLMLAALTEYAALDPNAAPDILKVIRLVAGALPSMMFDVNDVLHEPPFKSFFTDDAKDYVCGRGVLLRHLSSAAVRRLVGYDFTKNIMATNSYALASCDSDTQFSAYWNRAQDKAYSDAFLQGWGYGDGTITWNFPDDRKNPNLRNGILQAAGLDALGAAIRVSPA